MNTKVSFVIQEKDKCFGACQVLHQVPTRPKSNKWILRIQLPSSVSNCHIFLWFYLKGMQTSVIEYAVCRCFFRDIYYLKRNIHPFQLNNVWNLILFWILLSVITIFVISMEFSKLKESVHRTGFCEWTWSILRVPNPNIERMLLTMRQYGSTSCAYYLVHGVHLQH